MEKYVNYSKFKASDFLQTSKFIEWLFCPNQELESYWIDVLQRFPECETEMEKAKVAIATLQRKKYSLSQTDRVKLFDKIEEELYDKRDRKKRIKLFTYAASIVAILVMIFTLYMPSKDANNTEYAVVGTQMSSEKIRLVTSSNSIDIEEGADIYISDSGIATLNSKDSKDNITLGEEELNKIIVPYGKHTNIILADGSKIWINSGTEVQFPSKFNGNERRIAVKGEIFAEITPDATKPFIVTSDKLTTRVLGTAFNMSDYLDDELASVVLVRGGVQVDASHQDSKILKPSQMYTYDGHSSHVQEVDVTKYTAWIDGYFMADETPVSDVLRIVGRYYNINFEFDDREAVESSTCSGKLILSEDINETMNSIALLTKTDYRIDNNKIYINH